ncbi:N-methylhydantoinase A [Constrictibacter sp. MBR-5]|jgi:N-methylhydantoinase A|uniref:hydantoinase/oxoprolinase family protein n=1 Tax=Constrictibacter sp. MBR-5 TaxID=3156467 RepID=UPI00339793C4
MPNDASLAPPWRIGVDVGGTFTDLVLADATGAVRVFKVPSTPADPAQGVLDAIERAAERLGLSGPSALLERCELFVHGSTVATNTALEQKGAKAGLLTTAGFRDSLEIRRGIRENPWDHRPPNPPVLVPRHLRRPVRGRVDASGAEIEPLALEDVEAAAEIFRSRDVRSVGICFINSFAAPAHEQAAAARLEKLLPDAWISVSSAIAPVVGEYERSSTTALNAAVAPRTVGYLRRLESRLRDLGLRKRMLLIQNNGGAASVEQVASKPVTLLLSGPAAGVGALTSYSRAIGSDDLISMEIGGTSCDAMLMAGGQVAVTDEFQIAGYHLALPSIDIHTIGAGGGTIAGVDGAGLMYAGPAGAGAVPGPAAYGIGGTEPTVTDAQLVLGRLRPGPYAGGSVTLHRDRARDAMDRVLATPLGIDVEAAAAGIIRLVEQNLLHAVQRISIERGHDPRRFVLVACGGAGPMHGASVGRLLGCAKVYIPRLSGAFCAIGMLHANVRHDLVRVTFAPLDDADPEQLDRRFAEMEADAREMLAADGFDDTASGFARALDLRYRGQQWDVRVPLDEGRIHAERVRKAFEAEHERLFGHHQPGGHVEITKLRLAAIGRLPPIRPAAAPAATGAPEPVERRPVWIDAATGWREVAVYAGADLRAGHRLPGPLIVEEETTTLMIGAGDTIEVDAAGNYVVHLPAPETAP